MNNGEYALTKEEAQALALECLTTRWRGIEWRLREREVLDRAFGWVFSTEATTEDMLMEQCRRVAPGLVLVKRSGGYQSWTYRALTEGGLPVRCNILGGPLNAHNRAAFA